MKLGWKVDNSNLVGNGGNKFQQTQVSESSKWAEGCFIELSWLRSSSWFVDIGKITYKYK